MKNLIYSLALICALAVGAFATDVTIQPATLPGFVGVELPPNITTDPAGQALKFSATAGSTVLTCQTANCLRLDWVNIGGFTISLNGVNYSVAKVPNRNTVELTVPYAAATGLVNVIWYSWVQFRVYALQQFTPAGETYPQQPGVRGSAYWVRRYAASVIQSGSGSSVYLPAVVLPATTNATIGAARARYFAGFYLPNNTPIAEYSGFSNFCVPPFPNTTTWLALQTASCAVIGATPTPTPVPTPTPNVLSILNTFYAATDSGVLCNNVTDDTAALEAALVAARAQNKWLLLPNGRCRTSRFILGDRDHVSGAGVGKTVLKGIANEPIVTISTTAFNAVLENLTIEGDTSFGNQIGLNVQGTAQHWGFTASKVWIESTGSHGFYLGNNPFSIRFDGIDINNTVGYPVLVDAPIAPGITLRNFYVHALNPAGLKIGYRIKRGRVTCENCNGMDNVPSLQGSRYAVLGKRAYAGGADTYPDVGDTSEGANSAFVNWINTNFEAYEAVGVDHYYFSYSTFDGEIRWAYVNSVAGNNPNRIGLRYEVDETLGVAFAGYIPRGKMTATAVIGQPETDYKNGRFIHANNIPPLELEGVGGAVAPPGFPLGQYYDTTNARSEPLFRSDSRVVRTTVTSGTTSFNRPSYRYFEVNCTASPCNLQIPWPGWYRRQETVTITDVAGTAASIPIVITTQAQAKINGENNLDIRRNRGTVVLMPFESDTVTGVEWRIVNEYAGGVPVIMPTNGDTNIDFFARWLDTRGKLSLSSALYQYGNDIVFNGGNLIFVKGGNTVTVGPGTPAGSFSLTLPTSLPGTTSCVQLSPTGVFSHTGLPCDSGGGGGGGITSLNGLTALTQTFSKVDDTNVTLGISSVTNNHAFTLGWTGTLAASRLNANVVQSVVNDTNVTGSISAQALTLGFTGTLAKSRQNATTVYTDQANTFGAFVQTFRAGGNFLLADSTDTTKRAQFDLSNIATATTRTINVPNANSTTVQADTGASNQFLTAISAQGVISRAQPTFLNLSGAATVGQLPATTVNAVTNDTNVTGSISAQTLTLGFTGTLAAGRLNSNVVQSVVNDTNVTGSISAQALTLGFTGTLAKARLLSTVVYTDQANTFSTGAQSFASAASLTVPSSAGASPTASGLVAYDTTSNTLEAGVNGANKTVLFTDGNGSALTSLNASNLASGTVAVARGGTGVGTATNNAVLVGDGTSWAASVLPDCRNATTDKMLYNNSTRAWSCGSDQTGAGGSGIATLNTQTGTTQTFSRTNDTNVTLTITSSANDHNYALGWTGTLAKARQNATTVYTDQANTFGAFVQTFQAGGNFLLVDPTDTTKKAQFDLSNIATATTRTINVPNANSTTVQADTGASNQFLTAISAQGVISKAQPTFANLSGTATAGQLPATSVNSVVNDTNITGSISAQALTLGFTGTLAKARLLSTVVYTDQANTFSTGAQSFASAASLTVPSSAGASPTASGLVAYDTTSNTLEAGVNGANKTVLFTDGNGSALTSLNASNLASGTVPLARLSGITSTEIAANTIANNRLATIATQRIKGRRTASAGDVEDLTASDVLAVLSLQTTDSPTFAGLTLTGNLSFGADAASPAARSVSVPSVSAGTTDTAGAVFTVSGSRSTGTALGGAIDFRVADAGPSSGSSQNALNSVLKIRGNLNTGGSVWGSEARKGAVQIYGADNSVALEVGTRGTNTTVLQAVGNVTVEERKTITSGGTDNKEWRQIFGPTDWSLQILNDAYSAAGTVFSATRSGTTPTGFTIGVLAGTGTRMVQASSTGALSATVAAPTGIRLASDLSKTNDAVIQDTALSLTVEAGKTYSFYADLFTTSGTSGGVKFMLGGTATATSVVASAYMFQGSSTGVGTQKVTALGQQFGDQTSVSSADVMIRGSIVVNAAGTLVIRFAQNASNGTASVLKAGSTFGFIQIQ